jgi:putative glutamine amidotransferase
MTMRAELETDRLYLARHYSEAVEAAGGIPVYIPLIPRREYIENLVKEIDGVLLPGSASDVDPLLYGREPQTGLGVVHLQRDQTDLLVIERALPLLAICYGMQVLNVARGGTLIQDIGSQIPNAIKHEQGAPRGRRSHSVRLLSGGLAAYLAGDDDLIVNSHHHQAVETLGMNLRATAWSADGLIEAVEDTREGSWVQGVQWHPEIAWEEDPFSRALFAAFVQTARQRGRDSAKENSDDMKREVDACVR